MTSFSITIRITIINQEQKVLKSIGPALPTKNSSQQALIFGSHEFRFGKAGSTTPKNHLFFAKYYLKQSRLQVNSQVNNPGQLE